MVAVEYKKVKPSVGVIYAPHESRILAFFLLELLTVKLISEQTSFGKTLLICFYMSWT